MKIEDVTKVVLYTNVKLFYSKSNVSKNLRVSQINRDEKVIIITSIGRPELRAAIDSVKNQTYKNIEIIVVLDGSLPDGIDNQDVQVIYLDHVKNGNISRNIGITAHKQSGIYHDFNKIVFGKGQWVTTFETLIPCYDEVVQHQYSQRKTKRLCKRY
ncbi:glycosyltransferase|uniref:Glycosyltransferase n=1 Tax=Leuconostoc lactis TaxID=1246 RepID=A0A6L7AGA4_LEULA|nr:glycosyltransferase [Leuconostoc lactis]